MNQKARIQQISSLLLSFLTIVLISSPSYSSGITSNANSATCNNSTLETYTGTSNLTANWSANEITVKWYADSEAEQPMTTNTCFYGPNSALTIPSASSMVNLKPGYTFAGWRVRQSQCSFAQSVCGLSSSQINGLEGSNIGCNSNNGQDTNNASVYGLTTHGTWAAELIDGSVVKGVASCNNTSGSNEYTICNTDTFKPTNAFSTGDEGQYCWCKMTSYTPSGDSVCNVAVSSWVFIGDFSENSNDGTNACAYWCTYNCAIIFWDLGDERIPGLFLAQYQ